MRVSKVLVTQLAVSLTILSSSAGAQKLQLPRRASLGAMIGPGQGGVLLKEVLPGSTADVLQLKAGDVITSVNEMPIRAPEELVRAVHPLRSGDKLSVDYLRAGKVLHAHGKSVARKLENYAGATTTYGAFQFHNARVRDIFVQPLGKPSAPVVFEIQGYTCATIEAQDPAGLYGGLARDFVDAGIGFYRAEKPGMGDSSDEIRCEDIDYKTELDAFRTAYAHLVHDLKVSPDRIVMLGHSLGGLEAPMLAAEIPPRGVAVYGTVLKNWADYSIDIARYQDFLMNGRDPVAEAEANDAAAVVLRKFYVDGLTPQQIIAGDPAAAKILKDQIAWDGGSNAFGRSVAFAQQLPALPLTRAWRDTKSQVLSLYGASDEVALFGTDQQMIAEIVNWYRPGTARYTEVPGTMHLMDWVGDRHEFRVRNVASGHWVIGRYNSAVGRTIAAWIHDIMKVQPVREQSFPPPPSPKAEAAN